jgi:predicted O-methyltransferase YrrM
MTETPSAAKIGKLIEETYARGTVRGDDGSESQILPASVTPDRGAFVREMCLRIGATTALEVGMAWGMSTLHILEALLSNGAGAGAHVAVDCNQAERYHNAALRTLREAGLDYLVEFHEDRSELLLPRLVREGRRFDFAFIDGLHHFDHVFVDLFYTHRLLRPGGVVVLDDVFQDSVRFACRYVQTNYGYQTLALHPPHAVALDDDSPNGWRAMVVALQKPNEERPRGRFHFVPFFPAAPKEFAVGAAGSARTSPRANSVSRARANALRRDARLALSGGDRIAARRYTLQAIRLQPLRLKSYLRLLKTFLPQPMIRALSRRSARGGGDARAHD